MDIPDYQYFMLPILKYLQDQEVHSSKEIREHIIETNDFTEEQKRMRKPSGNAFLLPDRISWGNTYIYKAGLIKRIKRGHYQITDEGLELLKENHETLTHKDLMRYESFAEYIGSYTIVNYQMFIIYPPVESYIYLVHSMFFVSYYYENNILALFN